MITQVYQYKLHEQEVNVSSFPENIYFHTYFKYYLDTSISLTFMKAQNTQKNIKHVD